MTEQEQTPDTPKKPSGAQRRAALRAAWRVTPPPITPTVVRPPLPQQIVSGPWDGEAYVLIRAALRRHQIVRFEGKFWAYIQSIRRDGDLFRACVQPTRRPL
jgi:hypothetical protein